jgi:hypothetical protein
MDEQLLKLIQKYPDLLATFLTDNGFEAYVTSQAKTLEIAKLESIVAQGKAAEAELAILTAVKPEEI